MATMGPGFSTWEQFAARSVALTPLHPTHAWDASRRSARAASDYSPPGKYIEAELSEYRAQRDDLLCLI